MCATWLQVKGGCPGFKELAEMIMADKGLDALMIVDEARRLYIKRLDLIRDLSA